MARELTVYGERQIGLPSQLPQIQLSTAGVENLRRGAEFLGRTGQQIADTAAENSYLRAQTLVTKEMGRIASEHAADPEGMASAFQEWSDEFTSGIFDTEVREKLRLQIETRAQTAISVAQERRAEMVKQEQQYNALLSLDTLQKEIEDIASLVAGGNITASRQLQEIILRGQSLVNQAGPDGMPIFSAEARARRVLAVQDGVPLAVARAYVSNSRDPVAAANNWLRNGLTISMPDADGNPVQMNIRDAMSFESREKADNQVMGMVRDQITLRNYGQAQAEKAARQLAAEAYTELRVRMQDNPQSVPVEMLDANRNMFVSGGMADEFIELRKRALGQEPEVENGPLVRQLTTQAVQGNDVTASAVQAYNQGQITSQTLDSLRGTVSSIAGSSQGPAAQERRRIVDYVGKANSFGVLEKPERADAARLSFDAEIEAFAATNQRQPNAREVAQIGEGIRRSFAPTSADQIRSQILNSAPRNIPSGLINLKSPTVRDVENIERFVTNDMTARYGPDTSKWPMSDRELVETYQWLNQYKQNVNSGAFNRATAGAVE